MVNVGKTSQNQDVPFIVWLEGLESVMNGLSVRDRIEFMASCCERQFANYERFHEETGWGDPASLLAGLEFLRQFPTDPDITALKAVISRIEAVTPDTEDFTSLYTSAALDAAISLLYALEYCQDEDLSHCIQVACAARDSIYMLIQQRDDLDYSDAAEREIYNDPRMLAELASQQRDAQELAATTEA